VKCVFWHNSKYMINTWLQCSNSNENYNWRLHVQADTHRVISILSYLSHITSCILISFIIRSWIISDEGVGVCRSCSMLACLSMNISHLAWSRIIWWIFLQRTLVSCWFQYQHIYKMWLSRQIFFLRYDIV